jgi:hypothetical protein
MESSLILASHDWRIAFERALAIGAGAAWRHGCFRRLCPRDGSLPAGAPGSLRSRFAAADPGLLPGRHRTETGKRMGGVRRSRGPLQCRFAQTPAPARPLDGASRWRAARRRPRARGAWAAHPAHRRGRRFQVWKRGKEKRWPVASTGVSACARFPGLCIPKLWRMFWSQVPVSLRSSSAPLICTHALERGLPVHRKWQALRSFGCSRGGGERWRSR